MASSDPTMANSSIQTARSTNGKTTGARDLLKLLLKSGALLIYTFYSVTLVVLLCAL
jgi:hypothetical protein